VVRTTERLGLRGLFGAIVTGDDVVRRKPAPDVYLEAARRLGVAPERCVAIEDSANGMRSAKAAGMRVVAIPNRRYPPPADVLELADTVLDAIGELTPAVVS